MRTTILVLSLPWLVGCGTMPGEPGMDGNQSPSLASVQEGTKEECCEDCKAPVEGVAETKEDWCTGHEVPESKCTICHPDLIAQFKTAGDWCAVHGLPESVCPKCNHEPEATVPAAVSNGSDWCAGHDVPESKCTICHPDLIPQFKATGDWCAGHGLPESVCPKCNPEPEATLPTAVSTDSDWCAGHGVPESKCTLCHPDLIAGFQETGDWCAEHQLPESVCPQCNPERVDLFPIEQRVVRFINPAKEIEVGITTMPVRQATQAATTHGPARVAFDADRTADLRAVVHGIVKHIHVPLGARVEQGQSLFTLVSTEIAETQSKLRTAKARARVAKTNLQRQQSLEERQIASRYDVEQAETALESALAEVASAETILATAGASEADEPGQFTITAPIAGTVIHRTAVIGALATDEASLGMIADTSHMWVIAEIPEQDARAIHLGADLFFSGDDSTQAVGPIAWIGSEVNRETRTVPVRASVTNPEGHLRAHQFGRARIETRQSQTAWLVPAAAIQRVEQKDVVFVRREPGLYAPREVIRMGSGDWTLVEGHLQEGEQVVTTGAVLLRTEMLPGSIGAGCCEVEPLGTASKDH